MTLREIRVQEIIEELLAETSDMTGDERLALWACIQDGFCLKCGWFDRGHTCLSTRDQEGD